ncbi:hypothetical protein TEA_018212 [Camellia sinensis var. sinensis]|uniref:Uncharacterized protein n=1 Tax=Camellia sinensis var. sinensis TaxID=542762 RepID=A0A4V3WNC2_CAMSN|nr:hypothetical protein TEA_018212 [Camellia sinensis var. sinensis]
MRENRAKCQENGLMGLEFAADTCLATCVEPLFCKCGALGHTCDLLPKPQLEVHPSTAHAGTPTVGLGEVRVGLGEVRVAGHLFEILFSLRYRSPMSSLSLPSNLVCLRGNNLVGTLSPDMCQLTRLLYFDVRNNSLIGSIPQNIGNYTAFQVLSLQVNQLSGQIPSVIGLMQALAVLDLSCNILSGPIPHILGNLTYTEKLVVALCFFRIIAQLLLEWLIPFVALDPSLSTPFHSVQPAQTTGSFGFGNFGQTQAGVRFDLVLFLAISIRVKKNWLWIKDGNAETLYPRSSFAINCIGKGDVCKGDVVLFTQKVYKNRFGKRTIAGRVVKESYGAANQQHTFTTHLGIQIFKFCFKCTNYSVELTIKTDPQNSDYVVELGASRNFEPWRAKDESRQATICVDAMLEILQRSAEEKEKKLEEEDEAFNLLPSAVNCFPVL